MEWILASASPRRKQLLGEFFPEFAILPAVGEETVEHMRRLLGVADVIVPNLTEAEFLTDRYVGQTRLTREQARQVVDGLRAFGARSVVITSGREAETDQHVVWGYDHREGVYFTLPYRYIKVHFTGTGDMFSAVLVGHLLKGAGLPEAVRKAMDVLEKLIFLERDELDKKKGIRIERFLDVLND